MGESQRHNLPADSDRPLPKYEAPQVTEMTESEVLKTFQITSAAATWWGM
ncbi:MAG: hypothetical protein ABJD11_03840 [Gemmatimonadota bacterium]